MKFFERLRQLNRMSFFNINLGKSQRYTGFTLAEVLITLGIIGVVAAMTIPSLINKTNDAEYNSSLKEFYSMLSQAVMTLQSSDYNYSFEDGYSSIHNINALCQVLACTKVDTVNNVFGSASSNCLSGYKNYKSTSCAYVDLTNDTSAAELKNGMIIAALNYASTRTYVQLYVDTNGAKGPNMFGKDLNLFEICKMENGMFRPLAAGDPNSTAKAAGMTWPGYHCVTKDASTNNWACSYYRLFFPDKMP